MKNKKLVAAMKKRTALYAEGRKLYAEGGKLYVEGIEFYAEGRKLCVEGDLVWTYAVIAEFGPNEPTDWSQFPHCIVRGETY